jgi:hypothetical protein
MRRLTQEIDMAWLFIWALLALAAFFLYSAKTPDGMDWKRGAFAVAALGAAVWAWVTGLFQSAPPV